MWIYLPMYFEHFADEVRAEAFETCVFILELLAEDSVGSRESKKNDDMIVIDRPHPEFSEWRWLPVDELVENIVPFKRSVYEQVVAELGPLI